MTIASLKQGIQETSYNQTWDTVFKQDPGIYDHVVEKWKRKYLFPFGDISQQQKNKSLRTPYARFDQPGVEEHMEKLSQISKENISMDRISEVVNKKYRMQSDDFGLGQGQSCDHWL